MIGDGIGDGVVGVGGSSSIADWFVIPFHTELASRAVNVDLLGFGGT